MKQHTTACAQCPWRKNSPPGWLGASTPGEFLQQAETLPHMPCHVHVDYEAPDWEEQQADAPACAGRSAYLRNRCKQVDGAPKMDADPECFTWPSEFIEHHKRLEPGSLKAVLVYELFKE